MEHQQRPSSDLLMVPDTSEDQSNVFVWGSDSSGQLGINSKPGSKGFLKGPKEFIWKVLIKQISCGREHTALVSQDG